MRGVTIGDIVHYMLSAVDAEAINRRRVAKAHTPAWPEGAIAHSGNTVRAGEILPMIVCRVWGGDMVNGQVFLDGNDTYWATSRHEGLVAGTWAQRPVGE